MNGQSIAFGTSGWRARIADGFTFENVRRVAYAVGEHLRARGKAGRGVVVGYDTRFLSERFAESAARVLAGAGVRALLCGRDTPTPVLSHEIRRRGAGGGINVTASHNPPSYNGIKFSPANGGPALPADTRDIERRVARQMARPAPEEMRMEEAKKRGRLEVVDPSAAYCASVRRLVRFDAIRKAGLRVVYDGLFGTGRGYTDTLLRAGGATVSTVNDRRDVLFGGAPPEPTQARLASLAAEVRKRRAHIGLSNDGDADRFGVVEPDGTVLSPNQVLVVLLVHLLRARPWRGAVVRTVATTHLLDAIAKRHSLPLRETPVGFKYIGALMESEAVLIGGEESGGLSVRAHVPEKDGILACLLLAEARAGGRRPLSAQYRDIEREFGAFRSARRDLHLPADRMEHLRARMGKLTAKSFAGKKVVREDRQDGVKWHLEGGDWILVRLSGTEPLARVYAESGSEKGLNAILSAGERVLRG